jgi:FkbM family methyltransferase
MNFYSQWNEDRWLYDSGHIIDKGFYVDIGAADPFINSNTAFLDELGWNGLCVEPNKYDFSKRNCIIEHLAVNTYDGTCSFQFNGELGKLMEGEIKIPCLTLKTIIESAFIRHIDLMSIDTEGMEYDIFTSYYKYYYLPKPKLLIFEFNTCGNIDNRLKEFLLAYTDYELIHTSESNYIFKL